MVALPKQQMTVEAFLDWSSGLPKEAGRVELWDGQVVEKRGPAGSMNAERSQHWEAKAAIYDALKIALQEAGVDAHVAIEGPTVRFGNGRAVEPDVLVYFGPRAPRGALEIANPAIVVEVLSPSTAVRDLSLKLEGYFGLASVEHYLVIDPDKPLLIHHRRGGEAGILTKIVHDGTLQLEGLPGSATIDVELSEVLAG